MSAVLDSRSLEVFLAVAETLNFRQAAQRLHISQPPLSRAIRILEERLGTKLFVRDTRSVALTEAGERLLPHARKILRQIAQAEAVIADRDAPTCWRIGVTSAVEPVWFKGLAERIAGTRPRVAVRMMSDTSPRLVRQLRARRLDAAFIALPTETQGLRVTSLDRLPMVVALPSAHPLARRRVVSLADLAGGTLYWFERARQPAFFDHCNRVFARYAFTPRSVREPDDHHVLLRGVADGEAFALLPCSFASLRRAGVSYRTLKEGDELAVEIGIVTREGDDALHARLVARAKARQVT